MNKKTTAMATLTVARHKVDELLALKKITVKNLEELTVAEREMFQERLAQILADSKGAERDNLLAKIDSILPDRTKNDLWEHNHTVIRSAISDFMRQYGVMPTKSAIAEETGLSRQTVIKHLKEYKSHPEFIAEAEQFKFMSHEMLANVFKFGRNGNMRAARLYFEMVGAINKPGTNTLVTAQNNYIQINNTILSQENIKQLTAEQLQQIENIVRERVMEGAGRVV